MRKSIMISAIVLSAMAIISCKKQVITVEGRWVEPIPGMEGQFQGVDLQPGGVASSINMATLQYSAWSQTGDAIILTGSSIGNGITIEFTDTMRIESLSPDSLVLANRGMMLRYAREK